MEAIKLALTEAFLFRKEDAQAIRDAPSPSVPVSEPSWHVRCSGKKTADSIAETIQNKWRKIVNKNKKYI